MDCISQNSLERTHNELLFLCRTHKSDVFVPLFAFSDVIVKVRLTDSKSLILMSPPYLLLRPQTVKLLLAAVYQSYKL